MTWQFGILTDRAGHVHLGAVVAGSAYRARDYIELLAPIGAAHPAELDLEHLVVLVHGQDIANLRRLVEQCIDNNRLRQQLTELIELVGTASTERGMGSLSTVGTARHQSEVVPTFLDSPGSATVDLLAPEASAGGGDQDGGDGLCVVCGQRTTRTVRPMGRITDPISCCHAHDDWTILRAWIHQLSEFRQLQLGHRLQCRTCSSSCHCEDLADASGHPCACWPPIQDRQELCKEAPPS